MPTFTDNSRLFILAGVPGCGKSTWARLFFSPWQIVSTDAISEEKWPGEEYDVARNEEVFDAFHNRIGALLNSGEDVVADATSLRWQSRLKLVDIADAHDAERHLIFFDNPAQAVARNAQRKGNARVPLEAQDVMLAKYRESRSAILEESYTSTTIIKETT
jgi:predicted kinase